MYLILWILLIVLPGVANAAPDSVRGNATDFDSTPVSADQLVKAGAGVLHSITCQSDTAATAGTIIVYDSLSETGTQIWNWVVSAVEYQPRTLIFDTRFSVGLFIGYTTTADVNCTISWR